MQNFDTPPAESVILRRDSVPAGFREWKDSDVRSFGISLDELAKRVAPGAFVRVGDKLFFSRDAAESMSCR